MLKFLLFCCFRIYKKYKGKILRLQFHYYKWLYEGRFFAPNNFLFEQQFYITFRQQSAGKIKIGENVSFRKFCSIYIEAGTLNLANNVFFNNYCSISCLGEITINENTIFGEGVRLYDHNHNFGLLDVPIYDQGFKIGKIKIGKNCWIGANTIILNNVTIGDNVVIGANNLIYKDIPSNVVVKANVEKSIAYLS